MKKITLKLLMVAFFTQMLFAQETPNLTNYEFNLDFGSNINEIIDTFLDDIDAEINHYEVKEYFIKKDTRIFKLKDENQRIHRYFMFQENKLYRYEIQYDKIIPLEIHDERNIKTRQNISTDYIEKYGDNEVVFLRSAFVFAIRFAVENIFIYVIDIYTDEKIRIIYTNEDINDSIMNMDIQSEVNNLHNTNNI
jgi:hypothetical protein